MTQKDNDNAISEKLSQNDADAVTKRQASEIEKQAALIALGPLFEDCHDAMRDVMDKRDYDYLYDFWTNVEGAFRRYREMYDYAKSIGAIETLNHSNTKTQGE